MRTIAHRELRNSSSKILAEVKAGETIAVTNHGEVSAILVPPGAGAYEQLLASGRLTPASDPGRARSIVRARSAERIADVLDELKGDR